VSEHACALTLIPSLGGFEENRSSEGSNEGFNRGSVLRLDGVPGSARGGTESGDRPATACNTTDDDDEAFVAQAFH
jgi:hypothetical protein